MSVIFSRQCEYALQAVLFLALRPANRMTSIRELTKELEIPYHFVAKILQDLSRKGLLVSLRGPAGGFSLAKAAKDITLFQVVEAIDGTSFMERCVLGFPECSGKNPCAVHNQWGLLRENISSMLKSKSIAELAGANKKTLHRAAGLP